MLYQIIIVIGLALFMVNLILNLRNLRKPSADAKVPQPPPLISVLIPARNEEHNIRTCLESLQKQDYPSFEILVLDDSSEDNTNAMVSEIAAKDTRVKLIPGQPLPEGWTGKPFACQQLARKARGSWLLFVDADTVHAPHMLRSVLALAIELKTSLLSGFDRLVADTLPLKVVMPLMYFIMLGWAPLWWIQSSNKPKPSIAIGQFLLFSREAYWHIGGHEAVKNRIVEDLWLGTEIARRGGRHIAIDLSPVVTCNMYRTLREVWDGLGKSIYAVIAMAPVGIVALVGIAYLFYIAPFFWLWQGLILGQESFLWLGLVITQITIMLFMRWMVDSRFQISGVSMWFHPIGFIFYVFNVVYSALRWLTGAPVTWKERSYPKESRVEETLTHR